MVGERGKDACMTERKQMIRGFPKMVVQEMSRFVFPGRCPVCDKVMRGKHRLVCQECLKTLCLVTPPWCARCGKKLMAERELCQDCKEREHQFIRGRAVFEYDSIRKSLYRFKYGGRKEYAAFYADMTVRCLWEFIRAVSPDGLVPVPLSRSRHRRRGYNQSAVIAEEIGKRMHIPVFSDYVVRQKNTAPLRGQNLYERQNNLKNAFNIGQNVVKLKTIIIIDDIYTTGSTIDEVAATLKEFGAERVYFVVMACGVGM